MTWVKICGITNLDDAMVAVDAGADAVGFVFYEKSPRKVDPETACAIVEKLPKRVEKVGVFVDGVDLDWLEIVHAAGMTAVQHVITGTPRESSSTGVDLSLLPQPPRVFIALSFGDAIGDKDQVQALAASFAVMRKDVSPGFPAGICDTVFLDAGSPQQPGGTGKAFEWRKAVPIAEGMRQGGLKLVVAGGLNPDNVAEAIEVLKPWGVDVSSGVEACLGKKDPDKVRAFVQAVRRTEKSA